MSAYCGPFVPISPRTHVLYAKLALSCWRHGVTVEDAQVFSQSLSDRVNGTYGAREEV